MEVDSEDEVSSDSDAGSDVYTENSASDSDDATDLGTDLEDESDHGYNSEEEKTVPPTGSMMAQFGTSVARSSVSGDPVEPVDIDEAKGWCYQWVPFCTLDSRRPDWRSFITYDTDNAPHARVQFVGRTNIDAEQVHLHHRAWDSASVRAVVHPRNDAYPSVVPKLQTMMVTLSC